MVVPDSSFADTPIAVRSVVGSPRANSCRYTLPSRRTSAMSHSDSAFTTETPTPCSPPGDLVAVAAELAARVELGQNHRQRRQALLRNDVDRDSRTGVADGHRVVRMNA